MAGGSSGADHTSAIRLARIAPSIRQADDCQPKATEKTGHADQLPLNIIECQADAAGGECCSANGEG